MGTRPRGEGGRRTHRGSPGQACGWRVGGSPRLCAGLRAPSWFSRDRTGLGESRQGEAWPGPQPHPPAPLPGALLGCTGRKRAFSPCETCTKGKMRIFYFNFFSLGTSDLFQNTWTKHLAPNKHTLPASFWGEVGKSEVAQGEHPTSVWPRCSPVWRRPCPRGQGRSHSRGVGASSQPPDHPTSRTLCLEQALGTPLPTASV